MSNYPKSLLFLRHKVFLGTLLLAMLPFCAATRADTVTPDQAKKAVQRWLSSDPALGCPLGGTVADVRTCTPTNGESFHVVRLSEGGFVVTSADTEREPVVAFASRGDLVEDDSNPLWTLLKNDLAIRAAAAGSGGVRLMGAAVSSAASGNEAKWARLLGRRTQLLASSDDGHKSVSDMRVDPFVQSQWGQDVVGGGNCYNYFTPNNYPCGCVATAGAQIMRFFRHPLVSMPQYTSRRCKVDGVIKALTTRGGTYDWDLMPLLPDSSLTDEQRQAIGKLSSDIGICCGTEYWFDGSTASGYMLAHVLTNNFGYSSALAVQWPATMDKTQSEEVKNALLSNFDAGYPVSVSLRGDDGHVVVADGYGYSDGALYLHFNMGWDGIADAWYAPPAMDTGAYDFSIVDGFVFNINLASQDAVIYSGRVLDADGVPVEGASVGVARVGGGAGTGVAGGDAVSYVRTNERGIYSVVLFPGEWMFSVGDVSVRETVKANVATRVTPASGGYYPTPVPVIGNRCGMDFVLNGVASVAAPQMTPPSCSFYPSIDVSIACATDGATIRYTLDGTDPTPTSAVYTGPIAIDDDVTIKARAWKSGMNPSAVVSATYSYDTTQGAPKGDYFADPITISGAKGSRTIEDNSGYTVEPGEPRHTLEDGYYMYQYRTIWFKWTAPGSGTMSFSTQAVKKGGMTWTRYHTYVAVYTGDSLSSISRVAFSKEMDSENEYATTVTLDVEKGVTYRIVGMINPDAKAEFTFSWSGDLPDGPRHAVMFDAGGARGTPPQSLFGTEGSAVVLPGRGNLSMEGCMFAGWSDGTRTYPGGSKYLISASADVTLVATWEPVVAPGCVGFAVSDVTVSEGETATISVSGGAFESATSVKVYLTCSTAAADDLGLGKNAFPIVLSWEEGEIGSKTFDVPVKADATLEFAEFLTLQLAEAQGIELGSARVCTVTIKDPGYTELSWKIAANTATPAEIKAWNKLQTASAPYMRGLADPANAGKVTGSGQCASGKKVALKAAANKGFVFVGWQGADASGADGSPECDTPDGSCIVATTPSLVIDRTSKPVASSSSSTTISGVAEDATFYAAFITCEEDKAAVKLAVNGAPMSGEPGASTPSTNIVCGVAVRWPLDVTALSGTSVKVAGLPEGLKFTDKGVLKKGSKTEFDVPPNTIYGAPSAASAVDKNTGAAKPSAVKITVTTAGKSVVSYALDIVVDPLPAWAAGRFEGVAIGDTGGSAAVSVAANGKISGSIALEGMNWTFKSDSYSAAGRRVSETAGAEWNGSAEDSFAIAATASAGKETRDIVLAVSKLSLDYLPGAATACAQGSFGDATARLWRLPWTDKGDAAPVARMAPMAGAYSCKMAYGGAQGEVAFVLDEKGTVKGSAVFPYGADTRKSSFSANVLPMEDGLFVAVVLPPDAKKVYPAICEVRKIVGCSGDGADGMVFRNPGVIAEVASLHEGTGASGTVTVNPKYGQPGFGKKVTLTAKADKGSVFAGWYLGGTQLAATETTAMNLDTLVSQSASWSFEMPANDVPVTAKFIKLEEDKAAIKLTVDGVPLSRVPGMIPAWSNYCGVAVSWPVVSCGFSETTVKASGLPSGLKLVQDKVTKAFSVTGVPTAASKADKNTGLLVPGKVKFTVTTAGKSTETFEIDVVVLPLPAWAVGTFDGYVKCMASADGYGAGSTGCSTVTGGGWNTQTARYLGGIASLSIAANGKIAGKLLEGGNTWTLGAASFDAVRGGSLATATDGENLTFRATVIGKAGKVTVTNEMTLSAGAMDARHCQRGVLNALATRSSDATGELPVGPVEWAAWQNLWKRSDTKAEQPTFKKNVVAYCPLGKDGDADSLVTLTFKKDGVVAFAGKVGGASVSGSSQLVWNGGYGTTALVDIWEVTLYAPPKGTFAGWCEILSVKLELDAAGVVTGVVVE